MDKWQLLLLTDLRRLLHTLALTSLLLFLLWLLALSLLALLLTRRLLASLLRQLLILIRQTSDFRQNLQRGNLLGSLLFWDIAHCIGVLCIRVVTLLRPYVGVVRRLFLDGRRVCGSGVLLLMLML